VKNMAATDSCNMSVRAHYQPTSCPAVLTAVKGIGDC
jgi:hypothetical protein